MKIFLIILISLVLIWVVWSLLVDSSIESPKYIIVDSNSVYEIRNYNSYIIAEVTVPGNTSNATGQAFRELGGYIFGGNDGSNAIAMTAPVSTTQSDGTSVAMISPVATQQNGEFLTMAFSMPSRFTLENLPKPNSDIISFREIPSGTYAVLRFSGWVTESRRINKIKKLIELLEKKDIEVFGDPELLQYDRPTKFPLLRKNEIRIEIVK